MPVAIYGGVIDDVKYCDHAEVCLAAYPCYTAGFSFSSLDLSALYSKPALSATIVSSVDEAPRGWYMPVSHSLMVYWRVLS
jgi:hypothetical protein